MTLEQIKSILSSQIHPYLNTDTKHAAVMVAIYGKEPCVIMTEKPKTMVQHGGEVSFPGGKMTDSDRDLLDTAIRETDEEISLNISRFQVIGQLRPVQTRNSGFTIMPFVSILDSIPPLIPNSEVEQILHIPILPLLRTLGEDDDIEHRSLFEAYKLTYDNKIIWGASARILKQISDIFKQCNLL